MVYGGDQETGDECETKAVLWDRGVYTFFVVPITCFALGSGFVAYGLATSKPNTNNPFPSVIYLPSTKQIKAANNCALSFSKPRVIAFAWHFTRAEISMNVFWRRNNMDIP